MLKWSKTSGLFFVALMSVYPGQALLAASGKSAPQSTGGKSPGTDVRLLEDLAPAAVGKTQAETPVPAASETKPEGRSVSKSEVKVSDEGTVEIHVNDASLVEVLRMLSLQSQKNILCSKDVRGTVTANLYNVTIREALDQILHMNGYAYREKGSFINVYTTKELIALEEAERKVVTEVFRLHYTPAANAMTMLKPVLSTAGQVSATTPANAGIAAGGETGGNAHAVEDMLVVTDYPEVIEKVRKVLKELDRRPQQVLVEATILRAALSEDNALGVDFNVLAGVKFSQLLTNAGGQLTGSNLGDASKVSIPTGGMGGIGTGNSFTSGIAGGLKIGFISDNVNVFISALEGVTDTVVLANPKVLALNKQKGEVIVGRKDGYLTTTVTESSTVQTVEFLDTGTKLMFRPFIGDDGFVRMELHPEDSSGGLTSANLPFKITTEMTSNIMVKDGHTIVIGGLFREASDSAKSQVPGVGNVPLLGNLFKNHRDRTTREEIIILLTPHIIKDEKVYGKLSEEQLKRGEMLRVGVRRGMMPWGRERLAESCYESAVSELAKPGANNQKALWHLDCATNLNPKFIEAIELKQKVTGKEVTAVDASSVREFVKKLVLADKAAAAPEPAPGTKTEQPAPVPGKPANPTASAQSDSFDHCDPSAQSDPMSDPLARDDWNLLPEEEMMPEQPEADLIVKSEPATRPSEPAQEPVEPEVVLAPATRPSTATVSPKSDKPGSKPVGSDEPKVTITELPSEEVKGASNPSDDNK